MPYPMQSLAYLRVRDHCSNPYKNALDQPSTAFRHWCIPTVGLDRNEQLKVAQLSQNSQEPVSFVLTAKNVPYPTRHREITV